MGVIGRYGDKSFVDVVDDQLYAAIEAVLKLDFVVRRLG